MAHDSVTLAEYAYDALGRRIEKYDPCDSGERTQYYYDGWRVLSEHDGDDENLPMLCCFVYGNYIDEPVMMRNVLDDNEDIEDIDLYYVQDALYNCRALVKSGGMPVERVRYDAYGLPHVRFIVDMNIDGATGVIGDGEVNTVDWPTFRDAYGGDECEAKYAWLADYDNDGDVDTTDWPWYRDYNGSAGTTPDGYLSFYKNPYSFTGRRFDTLHGGELTLGYYRNRYYDPGDGRWLTRDPLGVQDGLAVFRFSATGVPGTSRQGALRQYREGANLYSYVQGKVSQYTDPYGLYLGISGTECCERDEKCNQAVRYREFKGICDICPKGWKETARTNCSCFNAARSIRQQAAEDAEATDLCGKWLGPLDAYRHCLASCRLARSQGRTCARDAGTGHELLHSSNPRDRRMDLYNNWQGREASEDCSTSCDDACMARLNSGDLDVIDTDCNGRADNDEYPPPKY